MGEKFILVAAGLVVGFLVGMTGMGGSDPFLDSGFENESRSGGRHGLGVCLDYKVRRRFPTLAAAHD